MEKKMKLLLQTTMLSVLAVALTGCLGGKTPSTSSEQIKKSDTIKVNTIPEISKSEVRYIINSSVIYTASLLRNVNADRNGCIESRDRNYRKNSICFNPPYKGKDNLWISYRLHSKNDYEKREFVKYAEKEVLSRVAYRFNELLKMYTEQQEKLKKVKIVVNDNTKVFSDRHLRTDNINLEMEMGANGRFIYTDDFVQKNIRNEFGGAFRIKTNSSYHDESNEYVININEVEFSKKPSEYVLENELVKATYKYGTFSFVNKTNKFLLIDSISGYYGGEISTTKDLGIKLAPSSITEHNVSFNSMSKKIAIKSLDYNLSYGFAIEINDSGKPTTLFKKTDYSLKDFK